jgi:ketosteroid isomerase-like protein
MSEEHIEALRVGYEALRRGDLKTGLAMVDPHISVFDHDHVLDTPRAYEGPEGIARMVSEAAESFDDHRYEAERFTDAADRALVAVRRRGRGKASQVEVDESQWHLWTFRGDTAVELRIFVSEAEALVAAGLSQSPRR